MGIPFRALPNGSAELFIHLNGARVRFLEKNQRHEHAHFVAGVFDMGYPLKLEMTRNGQSFKGICITFTPSGVPRLLGITLSALTNRIVDLHTLWGPRAGSLSEQLEEASTDEQRISLLNSFFLEACRRENGQPLQEIHQILDLLTSKPGQGSIEELARTTNHSYKAIYRLFDKHLGLCPKRFIKILRFNKACHTLSTHPGIAWGELVHRCGYYDQSHFIREFRAIMKESPCHFLKTTGGNFYLNRAFCFK